MYGRSGLIAIIQFVCLFSFSLSYAGIKENAAQKFELQLANNYHPNIKIENYWVSEKLDGVRAYWNGKAFISKQGNVYRAPVWFIQDFPNFALDGELWLGRAKFDRLSGIVRKQTPSDEEWRRVSYQVFDLPESRHDFDGRLRFLRDFFSQEKQPAWLKLIPQYKVKNEQELLSKLEEIEGIAGEGLMLHEGSSFYHEGRDDELLKLKTYDDAEARVIEHLPGKGKYKNALGALLVEAVNYEMKGKVFKIGTGFSDDERRNPPDIGKVITYKYFGLTSKGLPRFASFMRIRESERF